MTCADARRHLDDWPAVSRQPLAGAVVRHTWECSTCRTELVAALVLAERVRAAMETLPSPPAALRLAVLGPEQQAGEATPGPTRRDHSARARLARIQPYLPPLLRLAVDPLALVPTWLPTRFAP